MVLHNCSIVVIFAFENEGKVKDFIIATFKEKYLFIACFFIMLQNMFPKLCYFFIYLKYSWELLFLEKFKTHFTSFNIITISVFKAVDNETV